jgi:hypothetical protein
VPLQVQIRDPLPDPLAVAPFTHKNVVKARHPRENLRQRIENHVVPFVPFPSCQSRHREQHLLLGLDAETREEPRGSFPGLEEIRIERAGQDLNTVRIEPVLVDQPPLRVATDRNDTVRVQQRAVEGRSLHPQASIP